MKPNAVILARVSSKSQEDEGYSLDSQLKLLTGYFEKKDFNVVKVFKIAETASKQQSRRVFQELLAYISENDVVHLAVEKTDRFTRNFRDAVAIDDWLAQDENRRLHAVKENLILHKNAPSDVKFMWNIHLSVAKKYTDNLREEAMKGWAEKLAQGWLPAPPPPGYMTVTQNGKRIHIPNPETKSLIQLVFKKYLHPAQSISSITEEMNVLGIRTRLGKPHSRSRVQKMLLNPFYIGINRHNGKDYPGAQEPIISKEIFDRVQQKIHKGRPDVYVKHNSVFKALIRCEDCGTIVTWQLQKGRYYGVCKRTSEACRKGKMLREDAIEEMTSRLLTKLVCPSPQVIQWVAEAMKEQHEDEIRSREKIINSIQTQIDRIERMEEGLYDDKLSGEITSNKYKEKHEQFVVQKEELNDRLGKIDMSFGKRIEKQLVLLELSQMAAELYPKKTVEQKRLILSKLFKNLTLKDGILSVEYTNFAKAIAKKVQITKEILEAEK